MVRSDGIPYERAPIEDWLKERDTSFVPRETLLSKDVVPNTALKKVLNELGVIT